MIDDAGGHGGSGERSELHRVQHDDGSVAATVAFAVADLDGVDPAELEPLHAAIDPALLAALVEDDRLVSGAVTFDYREYRVTVDDDGVVVVRPAATPDASGRGPDE